MKSILKSILVSSCLFSSLIALPVASPAQGYMATAQITDQAVGDGSYDYTITLFNSAASTQNLNTFWFAWLPYDYQYDLLTAYPTITGQPDGWTSYVNYAYYPYYPDGYSIDFYNTGDPSTGIAPGSSATFSFNSTDSPETLMQTSPYYPTPTTTSYVYSGADGDQGLAFPVNFAPVPEPSTIACFCVGAVGMLTLVRRRK